MSDAVLGSGEIDCWREQVPVHHEDRQLTVQVLFRTLKYSATVKEYHIRLSSDEDDCFLYRTVINTDEHRRLTLAHNVVASFDHLPEYVRQLLNAVKRDGEQEEKYFINILAQNAPGLAARIELLITMRQSGYVVQNKQLCLPFTLASDAEFKDHLITSFSKVKKQREQLRRSVSSLEAQLREERAQVRELEDKNRWLQKELEFSQNLLKSAENIQRHYEMLLSQKHRGEMNWSKTKNDESLRTTPSPARYSPNTTLPYTGKSSKTSCESRPPRSPDEELSDGNGAEMADEETTRCEENEKPESIAVQDEPMETMEEKSGVSGTLCLDTTSCTSSSASSSSSSSTTTVASNLLTSSEKSPLKGAAKRKASFHNYNANTSNTTGNNANGTTVNGNNANLTTTTTTSSESSSTAAAAATSTTPTGEQRPPPRKYAAAIIIPDSQLLQIRQRQEEQEKREKQQRQEQAEKEEEQLMKEEEAASAAAMESEGVVSTTEQTATREPMFVDEKPSAIAAAATMMMMMTTASTTTPPPPTQPTTAPTTPMSQDNYLSVIASSTRPISPPSMSLQQLFTTEKMVLPTSNVSTHLPTAPEMPGGATLHSLTGLQIPLTTSYNGQQGLINFTTAYSHSAVGNMAARMATTSQVVCPRYDAISPYEDEYTSVTDNYVRSLADSSEQMNDQTADEISNDGWSSISKKEPRDYNEEFLSDGSSREATLLSSSGGNNGLQLPTSMMNEYSMGSGVGSESPAPTGEMSGLGGSNDGVDGVISYLKCLICERSFGQDMVASHMTHHHTSDNLRCSICSDMPPFSSKEELIKHMIGHCSRAYACRYCGKENPRVHYLKIHVRSHTGEKPYTCLQCGRGFADASTWRRHERVHTGEKPYECTICGRRIARRDNVKIHMRSHMRHKVQMNCRTCGKTFAQPNHLVLHERICGGNGVFVDVKPGSASSAAVD